MSTGTLILSGQRHAVERAALALVDAVNSSGGAWPRVETADSC